MQPKEGLAAGTYTAKLRIRYRENAINDAVQDVSFTVHPKAVLLSVKASSSADVGGKTDTLELTFKHPINLTWDSLVVGGAAEKSGTKFNSVSASENGENTVYTLAISSRDAYHSGDVIEVTVNLGNEYEFQKNTTGEASLQNTTATVVIPRAITSAHMIIVPEGWTPFILQFTFDKELTIVDPNQLEWLYTGTTYGADADKEPIRLTGTAASGATITGVYRVDADMGWTYRVTLNIAQSGSLAIGVPGWGVADFTVGDVTAGAWSPGGVAFFLDGEGHNYLTDLQSRQLLVEADALGGYVAPAYDLPTSVELDEGVDKVYIDGKPYDESSGLWSISGAGPKPYVFDGVAQPNLSDQLVVTLAEDWTRGEGDHEVIVVFGDDTVARGIITVEDIVATWPLTLRGSKGAAGFVPPADGSGGVGTGGEGVVTSEYGTGDGYFEAGRPVTITAAAADTGWRFDRWEQTPGDTAIELPASSPGTLTMPGEEADGLELTALYTDGVAPVSTLTLGGGGGGGAPADGGWTSTGLLTLAATDADVRAATGDNTTGAGLGAVASVTYKIDGRAAVTVAGAEASISLSSIAELGDGVHTIAYWAVDAAGNTEVVHTAQVGYDTTAPSGLIRLRGLVFDSFIAAPQFVRFYRGAVAVELAGTDEQGGSGVAQVEYLVHSGAAFGSESAASDAGGWMTADSFTLDAAATYDGTYIIYARITDAAGNKSVVATDGIVRYTDSALTATPPTFTKTSAVGVSAGLALHDNTVASVKLGGDGTVAGSAYNVTNGSLDFTATYLNSLPVPEGGSYSFTVQFNPQGLAYVPNGSVAGTGGGNGSGNNAPAEIVITIPMVKAPAVITLAAAPVKGTVFGNSTVLTAQVSAGANGTVATGEVKFFDDTALLGDGPVALRADGTAVLTVGFGAGPHALRVEYSGDGSFLANKSAVLSYSVDKAPQTAVSIERTDGTPVVGSLAVDYGDEPFALRAVGGSGGGAYEWSSDNTAVAAVDKATGTVTVAAVGSAIISVQRVGNDNYNPSAVTSFELKVERRPVRILSVAVADKGYDGTADAEFASTPVLDNVAPGDGQAIYVLLTDATAQFMTAPGGQPSADAGENKTVEVGGFTLGGAKLDSYELVSAPSVTTATISQATPVWDGSAGLGVTGGDSGDGALYYGQRLSRLALTGVVRGVNGEPLSGSLAWAPGVDVTGIPGSDPESALSGLAAGGYEYGAVFTPSGSFATNYRVLEGTVAVEVRQAEPGMAGGTGADAAPVGSPIFASDSGRTPPETLADSTTITGDVVFTYGGIATAIEGEWSWNEDDPDTATALADGYTGIGMKHPVALFTPDDPRIAPLTVAANVPVYSPRSEIVEEPAIGTVPYGGKVGDALIGEGGQVLAVAANDIDPDDYEDITAFGSWGWKNPELLITSKTGTQTAVLVFTPDPEYLVNLSTPPYDDRYLPAEKTVAITVEPVAPVPLGLVSDVPPLMLGQTLLESDVAAASYTFGGVAGLGEGVLTGTLAWADGSIEPGAAGYEADGLGGAVSESGLFVTRAIFTPDAALYGDAYASVPVDVTLVVAAREETQEALETVYEQMRDEVLLPVVAARANYRAEDVAAFEDALAAVNALLAEGTGSELAFGRAFDDLTVAKAALEHYHPILQHSALRPIAQTGAVGVTVEVGGVFESVASVSFNGVELDMTVGAGGSAGAGAGVRTLSLPASAGGVTVGTLSKGSAIVTLLPAFVDSLDNGKHVISVVFEDDYARGEQQAEFTIARPEEGGDGGGAGGAGGGGAGGGAGGGGAGGGAGGGGGGADADADKDKEKTGPNTDADKDDDKDEDASGADEGDKPSTGGDKVGGTTDTGKGDSVPASGGSNALLILLALAGVAILLIGGTAFLLALSKRRPHPDDDWR
ncbi:MAG: Ig-like domain repeat protein [Coriobacteriales bacterium]|nr:Ig-like domain repeat protein [Coriobacteriales bacterium]